MADPTQQGSIGKHPAAWGKFVKDILDYLTPSGKGKLPDVVRRENAALTGETKNGNFSLIGWIAKIALSIGFVATVAHVAKGWLNKRTTKNETKTYDAAREALMYEAETMRLRAAREEMLMGGPTMVGAESQQQQLPYGQYEINPEAKNNNLALLKQRQAQELQYAHENHR